MGIDLPSLAENLVLHGRSYWSETGFILCSGVSSICGIDGECKMGYKLCLLVSQCKG